MMRMMRTMVAAVVMATMVSGSVAAQTAPKPTPTRTEQRNPVVGWIGVSTMLVGGLMMLPYSYGTDYTVYGQSVCVNQHEISGYACSEIKPHIRAGLITMGIGGALMAVGFSKVTVAPQLGRQVVGATATVQW